MLKMKISRIVWILWMQGWDKAPKVARVASETWKRHNAATWDIRLIDRQSLNRYIDTKLIHPSASIQAQSDIVRLLLLATHGGVWADATALCMVSLDRWVPKVKGDFWSHLGTDSGQGPGCTWFIVSNPLSLVIQTWRNAMIDFWSNRTNKHVPYFWMDNLFNRERRNNMAFATAWKNMRPRHNCDGTHGAHIIMINGIYKSLSHRVQRRLSPCVPRVIKLSHKYGNLFQKNITNGQYAISVSQKYENVMCSDN